MSDIEFFDFIPLTAQRRIVKHINRVDNIWTDIVYDAFRIEAEMLTKQDPFARCTVEDFCVLPDKHLGKCEGIDNSSALPLHLKPDFDPDADLDL